MLQISSLTKAYGARTLFENITVSLSPRERLGLVGRNGSGKSTLLKLILDEEHPDDGTITTPRGYRIGHLAQHLKFTEPTIVKEVCLGLPEEERTEEYRAEIILSGLGFTEEDFGKAPAVFSGGFQIRLNLAKLLLSEPNLLLLDEPTNYLDIVSMRWLTKFLRAWRGEMIIISHDRLFMDSVTTHTMLIHRGSIRKVVGGTEKLYSQVEEEEEIYEKTRVNEEKKRKDLELFINRFRAQASKATLVQSKIKALERMGKKEELADEAALDFRFNEAPFPGKQVGEVDGLTFSYPGGVKLIDSLNFNIQKGDRIGIVGKNGKGKSTLLRLLNGELLPTKGAISISPNARVGYFGQSNIARLHASRTVEQEVSDANPLLHRTVVRNICGTMMFSGDDALKKVAVLSGGERSRVLLGRLLAQPSNLLLLDEPTNHLDMESIQALIDTLKTYDGAVVIVTHSELILKELAQRLVVFDGGSAQLFDHDYNYFLEKAGWGDEDGMSATTKSGDTDKKSSNRESRAPTPEAQLKALRPLKKKIAAEEENAAKLEQTLRAVETDLAAASVAANVAKITELSTQLRAVQTEIAESYARWEELTTDHDAAERLITGAEEQ